MKRQKAETRDRQDADTAVRFAGVSKRFRLGESHDSLADLIVNGIRGLWRGREQGCAARTFWALRDVGFSVHAGEAIGIIGPNGAGKSTILKLAAGILRADSGDVRVRGRLAALIEVGAGFHPDLTGRENIFLNGAILGMGRAEVRRKLDSIVAFAGLEPFLDTPVKRYSSGMYARLGFSIAAHVDPQVLLVDEVLSVGDALFRLRCDERMRRLVRDGTTLVFVTHNLEQMQSICQRAIVMDGGRISYDGPAREAVGHYMSAVSRAYLARPVDVPPERRGADPAAELLDVTFRHRGSSGPRTQTRRPLTPQNAGPATMHFSAGGSGASRPPAAAQPVVWLRAGEGVAVCVYFRLNTAVPRLAVELNARAHVGDNVLSFNSARDGRMFEAPAGVHGVTLAVPTVPLASGQYHWNVRIWDAESGAAILDTPFAFPLVIDDGGRGSGVLALERTWYFDAGSNEQGLVPPVPAKQTDPGLALVGEGCP